MSKFTISPDKLDETIKEYFRHHGSMATYVDLSDDANIENAITIFRETVGKINCSPLPVADKGGMKKNNKKKKQKNKKTKRFHGKFRRKHTQRKYY